MGVYINPGNLSFSNDSHADIYVDKTGLLEILNGAIYKPTRYFCVSRARRFGKSMAAGMIDAYYSCGCDSHDLFDRFAIAVTESYEEHINKYNVLHFDLTEFISPLKDINKTVEYLDKGLINDMRSEFPEVDVTDEDNAPSVINKIYHHTGRSFIIIIDEWDCLIRDEKDNTELILNYLHYLRGFFKTQTSKEFLALGYITGILPIKRIDGESAMNNFREYTMITPRALTPFFGFTDEEVEDLCASHGMNLDEIRKWYNGYLMKYTDTAGAVHSVHMYNPNSIVNAMIDHEYDSYWKNTGAFRQLNDYICLDMDGLKDDVIAMLNGNSVPVKVKSFQNDLTSFQNKDNVLTALIHMGYLGYDADNEEAFIPNEEVRMVFESAIEVSSWSDMSDALSKSDDLLRATWTMNSRKVSSIIASSHQDYTSILEYDDENSLALAITMSYYTARKHYTVIREFPTGKGFADMAFIPLPKSDKPAMIVELKWDKSADTVIDQIHDKNYTGKLSGYQNVLLVGINYSMDTKEYSCVIEDCRPDWKVTM